MRRTEVFKLILTLLLWVPGTVNGNSYLDSSRQPLPPDPAATPAVTYRFPDYFDLAGWANLLYVQLFPAKVTDIFPTNFITLDPRLLFFKLKVCKRSAVTDCMPYGNSSNGVPANLQGIWWTDGLGDASLAISSGGGKYDAKNRVLEVSTYADRQWAVVATDAVWQGSYWSISGAATFNAALQTRINYVIYLNEDTTFGQIVGTVTAFGIRIFVPSWLVDFNMQYIGQDTWDRKSALLFLDVPRGDYKLKRIIDGNGRKGPWFDKGWLTYASGIPLAVGIQVYPPL
eukprot:jgi/Botrbrau1/2332/Bobra.39_1s0021.1